MRPKPTEGELMQLLHNNTLSNGDLTKLCHYLYGRVKTLEATVMLAKDVRIPMLIDAVRYLAYHNHVEDIWNQEVPQKEYDE